MTEDYNKNKGENQKEIDAFFQEFDKISQEFEKPPEENQASEDVEKVDMDVDVDAEMDAEVEVTAAAEAAAAETASSAKTAAESIAAVTVDTAAGAAAAVGNAAAAESENSMLSTASKTRMERLSESKDQNFLSSLNGRFDSLKGSIGNRKGTDKESAGSDKGDSMTKKRKKKKKYTINKKQLLKFIICTCLAVALVLGGIIVSIVVKAPPIEPDNIYSLLAENSILYDDEGNILDSLLTNHSLSDGLRTNVSYSDMPEHLVEAFVAIEDKTFWTHNGFNVIRIFGAIKESVFEGGSIAGTSTITQQLARNLYLSDKKSERSLTRKIEEAYYAILLERQLSKEQIIEAYLNTISLGLGTSGVQAASQAYFSKDVADLTLAEAAALASIPKSPSKFALLKRYESELVQEDNEEIIVRGDTYTLVYNPEVVGRQKLVLSFMKDQGLISEAEYDEASAVDLKAVMNPSEDALKEMSSYFADYVIKEVVRDLMDKYDIDEAEAKQRIYNNGYRIFTTINTRVQKIAEAEIANSANFPKTLYTSKNGNILNSNGSVLLYGYDNYFDSEGTFHLTTEEYTTDDAGNVILLKGNRLLFYKTEVQGKTDYSIEFKDMFQIIDGTFYAIQGGYVHIPQQYKSRDEEGNLILSAAFFQDHPDILQFGDTGMSLSNANYTLKQKVIQPQSAMVIFDYKTGGIKAMVGGRNVEGRLLFNRATSPRQPGSSIKPIAVYGPALQSGVSNMNAGIVNAESEGNSFGQLWTAASVIDDKPLTFQGKTWPKNWYSGYRGLHTLRRSVEQSVNTNAVQVFTEIGIPNSVSFLKKLGVTSVVETGDVNDMNAAALALGGMSYGISPLEMAAAYGAFPNQGNYTEPVSYTKVTNKRGEIILENTPNTSQVMDRGVAFIMTDILRTTVTNGIAGAASIGSHPVAGKTGTTTDNYDAWFVGVTPYYAAALWIGNDVNIELSKGSGAAAALWSKIMKQVHVGMPAGSFPTTDNVISLQVDSVSGRLPSELSAMDPRGSTIISEYFVKGTEPTTVDNVHAAVTVCNETHYLATPWCPHPVSKVAIRRPLTETEEGATGAAGEAGADAVEDGVFSAPIYYCHLHNLDIGIYPIHPGETLNPNFNWDGSGGSSEEEGGIVPIDPDDGNGDGDGNGNGPPGWIDSLN